MKYRDPYSEPPQDWRQVILWKEIRALIRKRHSWGIAKKKKKKIVN